MIQVTDLVRRFGETRAVERVSFHVAKGELLGFLGPNGAGKTTMLRMITGFLPPTSGEVTIGGRSATGESKATRRLIGYLPETNPLYEDMRVREYLSFRAALKGIPWRRRRARTGEVMDACEVAEVQDRLIGACSKGYRQRVGLADALLADPPVLVLDEPTVGLDPGQIVHTRELIKALGRDHTVILSTHILPEVEAICSRALILHRGKLLYDGSVDGLRTGLSSGKRLTCRLAGPRSSAEECLRLALSEEEIHFVAGDDNSSLFTVIPREEGDRRIAIFKACAERDLPILEMTPEAVSLEEAFLSITTMDEEALEEVEE